jgi:hypothetical protein
MTFQKIGLGTAANDGTGDDLRTAGAKMNAMNAELFQSTYLSQRRATMAVGAAIGDSITAQGVGGTTKFNSGYWHWMEILSLGRLYVPASNVFATGGWTTTQIEAHADSVIALATKPDFCLIYSGANTDTTAQAGVDAMVRIIKKLMAANILPVIGVAPAGATGSATSCAVSAAAIPRRWA